MRDSTADEFLDRLRSVSGDGDAPERPPCLDFDGCDLLFRFRRRVDRNIEEAMVPLHLIHRVGLGGTGVEDPSFDQPLVNVPKRQIIYIRAQRLELAEGQTAVHVRHLALHAGVQHHDGVAVRRTLDVSTDLLDNACCAGAVILQTVNPGAGDLDPGTAAGVFVKRYERFIAVGGAVHVQEDQEVLVAEEFHPREILVDMLRIVISLDRQYRDASLTQDGQACIACLRVQASARA